jgi:hypothetical protein
VLGSQPYRVDDEIHHSVQGTGLEVQAIASQERPHVNPRLESIFGGQPRYEHLIALKKPAG